MATRPTPSSQPPVADSRSASVGGQDAIARALARLDASAASAASPVKPGQPAESAATASDAGSRWARQGKVVSTDPAVPTPAPTVTMPGFSPHTITPPAAPPAIAYIGSLGPFREQLAQPLSPSHPGAPLPPGSVFSQAPTPPTAGRSRDNTSVAWMRAATRVLKFSPALMVIVGAGYFFNTMFGKMSADDLKEQGLVVPEEAAATGMSRAEVMVQQTKSVVAAQTRHVDFANQLAELGTDAVQGGTAPAPVPAPAAAPVAAPVAVAEPPPPPVASAPPVSISIYAPTGSPRELVFTGTPPDAAFVRWARETRLSGVRAGPSSARAMVNNVVYTVGDVVEHQQKIVFEAVDVRAKTVVFTAANGSRVARPF